MDFSSNVCIFSNAEVFTKTDFSNNINKLADCYKVSDLSSFDTQNDISKPSIHLIEADKYSPIDLLISLAKFTDHNIHKIFLLPLEISQIKYKLIEQGATDIFINPYDLKLLYLKIRTLSFFMHSQQENSQSLEFSNMKLLPEKMQIKVQSEDVSYTTSMTPTQFRILSFLMQNPGSVRSRREIMENVFGCNNATMERNIDTHISKIRKILGKEKKSIISVHGRGYKFINF